MKLGHKPRFPKPLAIMKAIAIITASVPTEEPPVFEWRKSFQGTPNVRMAGTTDTMPWIVDIYAGNFFRVTIGNGTGEVQKSLMGLVGYMRKMLGLGAPGEQLEETEL